MEKATERSKPEAEKPARRRRGPGVSKLSIDRTVELTVEAPAGSRYRGGTFCEFSKCLFPPAGVLKDFLQSASEQTSEGSKYPEIKVTTTGHQRKQAHWVLILRPRSCFEPAARRRRSRPFLKNRYFLDKRPDS